MLICYINITKNIFFSNTGKIAIQESQNSLGLIWDEERVQTALL